MSRYHYAVAGALACFVLGSIFYFGRHDKIPAVGDEPVLSVEASASANTLYVAQIANISNDVAWGDATSKLEFLMRVRAGDRLELESGLVQLDYFSGATVLLCGPCSFVPTGAQSGQLDSGHLTGEVAIGDFLLTTPAAEVLDLGTRFGVSVDDIDNTDVRVFDGKVQVTAGGLDGSAPSSRLLTEGMAVRAVRGGQFTSIEIEDDERFARALPEVIANTSTEAFSLVDALSCDKYGRYRLASATAPDTGEAYEQSKLETEQANPRQRHGTYHTTRWHPLIDGVFIPANQGIDIQCNSSGQAIDLVANGANTSGPIWSRQRMKDTSRVAFHENFWGRLTRKRVLERLESCELGMIGVHANVGLTFDLDAIRRHCGHDFVAFRTVVSNLDNSDEYPSAPTKEKRFIADFRVFVGDQLSASRLGFGRTDGDAVIEVSLRKEDKFLTVVSTDAGHYWYDQVVMVDPILVLKPTADKAALPQQIRLVPSADSTREVAVQDRI